MSFPNLSALAIRERAITLLFLLLSIFGGLQAFVSMGRAEDPAFTVRVMVVSVLWPGATVQALQEQVVDRLEKRIQEVELLHKIETTIRPGRADLQVEFEDFTPSEKVPDLFYQVRRRMADEAGKLPAGVTGPLVNEDFGDVYFSLLALHAPGMPMRELTREAEAIRDRLQRVGGVHKALLIGERSERVYVEFDNATLVNLGIPAQAIFAAIDAHNAVTPAGLLETQGPRVYLRVDADLSDPATLADMPIRIGERSLRLGDIAKIHRGYEDPPSYLTRANGDDAVLLGIVMDKGIDGLTLGKNIASFIDDERSRLPLGMTLDQLTNQAEAISSAVNLFQAKFLIAVGVVMAVSILAIGLRAGLVVGIAIPVTLGVTFLVMKLDGINLDRITLGALIIALGLLVDDAIIAIEMMLVKLEEGWERTRAAAHAWVVTAAPMLFGTLVTASGFVPIGFAQSGVGEYAGNIFWVLAIALLVSWLVAVTFTPFLGVYLLKPPASGHHAHTDGEALYQSAPYRRLRSIVRSCVTHRKVVVGATVGLLVLSIFGMATAVQKQFFPGSDRPEVLVSLYLPQGSSIEATDAVTRRAEALIRTMPQVRSLSAYVGGGAPRFFISANPEQPDPAFAKLVVVTHDAQARDEVMAALRQHVANGEFPEARVRVSRLLYGPPVVWPIEFRVIGADLAVIRDIAHRVREVMAANTKINNAHLEWDERVPTLHLVMDPQRLRLLGLEPRSVAQQLQYQLDGVPVTALRQDIRSVELRARGTRLPEGHDTFEIVTEDGRKVPVSHLGSIEVRYEEPVIKRYNREPFVSVRADLSSGQPNDVTLELWDALSDVRATLPAGYRIDLGGSMEASGKANASIQKLFPVMLALMLIFVMLQMRSFSGTFMVIATAPLGLIGAVLGLLLFGQPFGFVALLGLIGLAGILMRNTLILTQQVADNLAHHMEPLPAIVEAAVRRARPVLLTALAAVLAFVPLTHDSFWGPLAYVLIGGVAVGTLITLLFVPALYAMWFRLGRT